MAEISALTYWILIVSFAKGDTGGLYLAKLDVQAQTYALVEHITTGINRPIFARFSNDGKQLFVVDNDGDDPQTKFGALAIYTFDAHTGKLTLQNRTSTLGKGSCYVGLAPTNALIANYSTGSVTAIPYTNTGSVDGSINFQHTGKGADPRRQTKPHAHSFVPSPDGQFALAADLGTDEVTIHPITQGKVQPVTNTIKLQPGAGPRHIAFSPDASFMFVINELDSTLNSYRWDAKTGNATAIDSISTLPPDFQGNNAAADIYTHHDMPIVYTSNRGVDSIAISQYDKAGKLKLITNIPSGGGHPRGFALTHDGQFMLVANRDANNVLLFTIEGNNPVPVNVGKQLEIPMPMCVTTLPIQ
jgi:6-phosphogluconolactonase